MPNGEGPEGGGGHFQELIAAAVVAFSVGVSTFLAESGEWGLHVVFFSVGQADAIALVAADGSAAVIDAGNSRAHGERVAGFLRDPGANGVGEIGSVALAFATHYDADHIRGFPGLAEAGIRVDSLFDQGPSARREAGSANSTYKRYLRHLVGTEAPSPAGRRTPAPGDRWELGAAEIRVLAVNGDRYGSAHDIDLDPATRPADGDFDENCGSIAILVRLGQFELYTAGDQTSDDWRAFADTEMAVVSSTALGTSNRDIDVFKANHHGSDSSNGPRFLHTIDPEVAVISSELGSHGIPKAVTVQELVRNGAVVFITGNALDEDERLTDSPSTSHDDGFEGPPAGTVVNDAGDVHLYVAPDGDRYQVVAAGQVWEFSARDADSVHGFAYAEDEYPADREPGLDDEGLPECRH